MRHMTVVPQVEALIAEAEKQAERTVGIIRMVIALTLGAVFVAAVPSLVPLDISIVARQLLLAAGTLLAYFILGLASFLAVALNRYRPWMAWVAATGDGAFLLAGIWLSLANTGMPANYLVLFPPLWLAPVVLAFGALRYNPALGIYLIVLLAGGFLATAMLGGDWSSGLPEAPPDYIALLLSPPSDIVRLAMLCLAGLVLVIAVVRSRTMLTRAISETVRGANLTRYLPRQIADRLAETGLDELRRGRRQNVAVLFTDIRSFTEMSESLAPEALSAFVTGFRTRVVRAADASNGTIDKFIGDAAMIVFGISGPDGNHAAAALQCARLILQEMKDWSAERAQSGDPAVRVGVGVHYGEAFCGAIGDETRLEYTVLGDTVNVAARLEELTKSIGLPLVVSKDVTDRAGIDAGADGWQAVETTQLRGRTGQISVMAYSGKAA